MVRDREVDAQVESASWVNIIEDDVDEGVGAGKGPGGGSILRDDSDRGSGA